MAVSQNQASRRKWGILALTVVLLILLGALLVVGSGPLDYSHALFGP